MKTETLVLLGFAGVLVYVIYRAQQETAQAAASASTSTLQGMLQNVLPFLNPKTNPAPIDTNYQNEIMSTPLVAPVTPSIALG